MNSADPMFSVITCCYNQGHFIEDCIRSVLDQQYDRIEHIIIDSGSDETRAICERYAHVQYRFQPPAGQSAALNYGFALARGEIIAWLNADDYYLPGAFKRVVAALQAVPAKTLIGGEAHVVNAGGGFMWKLKNGPVPFYRLLAHPLLYRLKGCTAMPCQPAVFFPRQMLADIGLLRADLKYGMDYEFWLRALEGGYRFRHIRQVFACYRYHDTSLTSSHGYDAFLPEWEAVSAALYQRLPPSRQQAANRWSRYFQLESIVYRRHRRGIDILNRLHHDKQQNRLPAWAQAARILHAYWVAPWLVATTVHRAIRARLGGEGRVSA